MTFTLPGFTTVRREGIELTATFVATVNADLRVAAVAETVTVHGETPIVDVQSSQTVRTIDSEVFAGIPSSRWYAAVTVLMPGISAQGADVGGVAGNAFSVFQAHGGRRNEGQVQINGLSIGWQGMGVSGYAPEVGSAQEISFQVTGGLGEAATGGPQMNLIPQGGRQQLPRDVSSRTLPVRGGRAATSLTHRRPWAFARPINSSRRGTSTRCSAARSSAIGSGSS